MATETLTKDGYFDLKTPLLLQGLTTDIRAKTDRLQVAIKVYADGGENLMHSHNNQDHSFVVLSGEAEFHVGTEDNVKIVGQYEGVMLPKDVEYRFGNIGEGNLVMLRIGASIPDIEGRGKDRSFIKERIEMPGKFFPDDV